MIDIAQPLYYHTGGHKEKALQIGSVARKARPTVQPTNIHSSVKSKCRCHSR